MGLHVFPIPIPPPTPASTLIPLKAYSQQLLGYFFKKKKTRSYYSRTWNLLIGFHELRIKHILFAIAILFSYHPLLLSLSSSALGSSYSSNIPGSFLFQNFTQYWLLLILVSFQMSFPQILFLITQSKDSLYTVSCLLLTFKIFVIAFIIILSCKAYFTIHLMSTSLNKM